MASCDDLIVGVFRMCICTLHGVGDATGKSDLQKKREMVMAQLAESPVCIERFGGFLTNRLARCHFAI